MENKSKYSIMLFAMLACIGPVSSMLNTYCPTGGEPTTDRIVLKDGTEVYLDGNTLNSETRTIGALTEEELASLEIEIEQQDPALIQYRSMLRQEKIYGRICDTTGFVAGSPEEIKWKKRKYMLIEEHRNRLLEECRKQVLVELGIPDDVYVYVLSQYLNG